MTTWHPDTCGCEITLDLPSPDFDWVEITAAHVKSVTSCQHHTGKPIEIFNRVYHKENKVKNQLLAYVQANQAALQGAAEALLASPLTAKAVSDAGAVDDTLATAMDCPYCVAYDVPGVLTFDDDRAVNLSVPGIDTAALQAWADQNFGAGVVIVG